MPGSTSSSLASHYLSQARQQFRRLKTQGDRALAQVSDADFFRALDPDSNSLAVIVKHMAGNMASRWQDFLTSDGEKPDRQRDREFEIEPADTRASLMARWEASWKVALDSLEALEPADLERTVFIRTEPHTVVEATERQLAHGAGHVGQIVLLAKHFAGAGWQTLSIPKGKSAETNERMAGRKSGSHTPRSTVH